MSDKPIGSEILNGKAQAAPYVDGYVFQMALCLNCDNAAVPQSRVPPTVSDKAELQTFGLAAHNSLVMKAGILCTNPKLVIYYGLALIPAE